MASKRQQTHEGPIMSAVQIFQLGDPVEDILECYRKEQVVLIKNCVANSTFGISDIKKIHLRDLEMVNETFSMEAKEGEKGWGSHSSADLFGDKSVKTGEWYASFIAQMKVARESGDVESKYYSEFRNSLPMSELPLSPIDGSKLKIRYTAPIWVFVGQNEHEDSVLRGRPEHIDSVNHDGTWHLQSSGTKWWYIRPAESKEWGSAPMRVNATSTEQATKKRKNAPVSSKEEEFADGLGRLKVVVEEGDILIINTRVWWHQTRIPFTGTDGYSISYAIDFFCKQLRLTGQRELDRTNDKKSIRTTEILSADGDRSVKDSSDGASDSDDHEEAQEYSNIEGLYASRALRSGEVVFYESELPDCALPRSDDPSCEIVWLEDGSGALFALKDLAVGDWLTVAPSDSEDDSDDDDEEDDEGDDNESDNEDEDDACCEEEGSEVDEDEEGESADDAEAVE